MRNNYAIIRNVKIQGNFRIIYIYKCVCVLVRESESEREF